MSDHEHADIARRLREQGQASAPADLRAEVMAQVAAEPRRTANRRSNRWWRPMLATAAVACAIGGAAIGVSRIGDSTTSSSGASSAAAMAQGEAAPQLAPPESEARTYNVPARDAQRILAPFADDHFDNQMNVITVTVPDGYRPAIEKRLSSLEKNSVGSSGAGSSTEKSPGAGGTATAGPLITVVILPPHDSGN